MVSNKTEDLSISSSAQPRSTGPIKIGFISSLRGAGASGGRDMLFGIRLFLEQICHEIAGRKVELIVEDDNYSTSIANDKIRKLVELDKVHVLAGTIPSNIAYAVAPFVDAMQVPMIFPITGADNLTMRNRHRWVVRTSFASSQYGLPFGEWVYNELGCRTIAVFGLDFALGWEFAGAFQTAFEGLGGKVVQREWASQSSVDFSSSMKRLKSDVDAVLLATSNQGAENVLNAYAQHGPKRQLLGIGPSFDETVFAGAGEAAVGGISVSHHSAIANNPANLQFVSAFKAKHGEAASTSLFAEGAYVSGLWIKAAVEAIDGDVENKERFLAALKSVELKDEAPRGPMRLDEYGNPIQTIYIRRVEKINGRFQNSIIETFENLSQFGNFEAEAYMKRPNYSRDFPPLSA